MRKRSPVGPTPLTHRRLVTHHHFDRAGIDDAPGEDLDRPSITDERVDERTDLRVRVREPHRPAPVIRIGIAERRDIDELTPVLTCGGRLGTGMDGTSLQLRILCLLITALAGLAAVYLSHMFEINHCHHLHPKQDEECAGHYDQTNENHPHCQPFVFCHLPPVFLHKF